MSRSIGRPSKLTPQRKQKLLDMLRLGMHFKPACELSGISYPAFSEWMRRGRDIDKSRPPTEEYVVFVADVEKAIAESELANVAIIAKAAKKGEWKASTWMLERRHPQRWANTHRLKAEVDKAVAKEMETTLRALERLMPENSYQDLLTALAAIDRIPDNKNNAQGEDEALK